MKKNETNSRSHAFLGLSKVSGYLGTAIGCFAVITAVAPDVFASPGDGFMALAILTFASGFIFMIVGCIAALFSGEEKWKLLGLNAAFLVLWFASEVIRTANYGR